MRGNKIRKLAYITVAALGGVLALYLFIKYAFFALLPFFIAWLIAFAVRPIAEFLGKYIKIPVRVMRVILALFITLGILTLLGLGIWQLSRELWRLFSNINEGGGIEGIISEITSSDGVFGSIFGKFGDTVGQAVYQLVISLLQSLGKLISSWVGLLPRTFLFIIITVISSVYFAKDIDMINGFVLGLIPKKMREGISHFKSGVFWVAARYLRSYLLLMLITFVTMLAGMLILRMPYAFLIAMLLAVVDLLPILGVGTVLVPWCIYEFVLGTSSLAIGLIILYVVHTVIRQFAEPKILGKNLGIHPLVTLIFLYVGYTLFGFIGILIGPVCTVLFESAIKKKNSSDIGEDISGQGAPN